MQLYKIKYIIVDSAHADMEALRCFNSIRNAKKKIPGSKAHVVIER